MPGQQEIVLKCKDHTVSGEIFDLVFDKEYEMLVTFPKIELKDLGRYYESKDYISHTDSNKSLIDKIYQLVKKHAIQRKIKLINSFELDKKNVLDIGCGTGDFLLACKKNDWSVFGVEPDSKARDLTLEKLVEESDIINNTIKPYLEDFMNENNPEIQFDVITMWHVLEHVPNLKEYIQMLKTFLKPNGVLIIAVPNFKSYDAGHYKEYWAAYDVPRHQTHFSRKSIQLLFQEIGMEVLKILPMKFDAYYVSLLSEKYKFGFSNPLKALYRGFQSNLKAKGSKEFSSLIHIIKSQK